MSFSKGVFFNQMKRDKDVFEMKVYRSIAKPDKTLTKSVFS